MARVRLLLGTFDAEGELVTPLNRDVSMTDEQAGDIVDQAIQAVLKYRDSGCSYELIVALEELEVVLKATGALDEY